MLSRKIGDEMPKLLSVPELFHTLCESLRLGASPLSLAIPHGTCTSTSPPAVVGTATVVVPFGPPAQPGGKVSPIVTVSGVPTYTLRVTTTVLGTNWKCSAPSG